MGSHSARSGKISRASYESGDDEKFSGDERAKSSIIKFYYRPEKLAIASHRTWIDRFSTLCVTRKDRMMASGANERIKSLQFFVCEKFSAINLCRTVE